MKKRYLLAGLLLFGAIYGQTPQYKSAKAASELRTQQRKVNEARREAKKKAAYESQFLISSAQRTACRSVIQQAMHDPNSFRWEGSMSDMRRTGVLKFSGTNAFGGRVQQTYICK